MLPIGLLAIGLVVSVLALVKLAGAVRLHARGKPATATVVDVEEVEFPEGPAYQTVVELIDDVHGRRTAKLGLASFPAVHAVGDRIEVRYDVNAPYAVRQASFLGLYGWSVLMMAIGAASATIGIVWMS